MPDTENKITLDKAIEEYSKVRACIAEYFEEFYPDVIEKEIFEKAKNRAEKKAENSNICLEDITQELPLLYNDFLNNGKIPDAETYSPLSTYIFDCVEEDFSLEDMIEIRKMNLLGYIGLFKIIKPQNDRVLLVRNIISGEDMEITSSNVSFKENENIDGNMMLQHIQPWKGYNFCCGNGIVVLPSMLKSIIKLYVKQPREMHYSYYSSMKNLEKTFDILDEQKLLFLNFFKENPKTFFTYDEYKKEMAKYFYECKLVNSIEDGMHTIENKLQIGHIKSWKFGINVHISHEGLFTFSDHLQFEKYILEYLKIKNKKLFNKEMLAFFTFYIEAFKYIPCEVLLEYKEKFPKQINKVFKNLIKFYSIDFPYWETLIRFWHPDHPEYMPISIFLEPRLTQLISGNFDFGRNSPCICGSNIKFKLCCGKR